MYFHIFYKLYNDCSNSGIVHIDNREIFVYNKNEQGAV